jgi:tetratricopeptide (TPR) repeat protein
VDLSGNALATRRGRGWGLPGLRLSRVIVLLSMHSIPNTKSVSRSPALFLFGLLLVDVLASAQNPTGQTQSPTSRKPVRHDSVEVVAHLTPEEVEDGKLTDADQPIALLQQKGGCTPELIQRYQSEVIPLAEKSTFNVLKNKFLFLANRDIGSCYLVQRHYAEAEQIFKQIMEYMPIWPGKDDSDYPINFRQIATTQMGQQRWEAAEASLNQSVALFDPQIERALKSDSEFSRTEHAGNLIGGKARSLSYLAIVYLREGRTSEALKAAELAYEAVTRLHVQATFLNEVLKVGSSVAEQSGDEGAIARWSQRIPH